MSHDRAPVLILCELADPNVEGLLSFSPFCLKAHHALRLAGLTYERRHGQRPSEFAPLNPAAQVPVLLADGSPICDSTTICAWIDERTGALSRGLDARAKAEAWLWEDYADTALNGFLVASRWADDRNWPSVKQAYFGKAPWPVRALVAPRLRSGVVQALTARDVWRAGADACWSRFERALDQLDQRAPTSGFWVGERPSIADVAIFAQLHSLRTPLTPWQSNAVAARTSLSTYLDRVAEATRGAARTTPRAPREREVTAASPA